MDPSSRGCDQTGMGLLRTLQGWRKSGRVKKQFDEALLVFGRQTDELSFIDCPAGDLLGCGNDEITDTAALKFRGPLDDPERVGGDASFDPRGAICLLGHGSSLLPMNIVRDYAGQFKADGPPARPL